MASTSRSGAGGKIVNNRRKQRLSATPYDRPQPPPPPAPKSPNWFSGVVVPSARAVASGAGKLLSSIFTESESSSEDEDYDSEEDTDHEIHAGVNAINEMNVVPSELMQHVEDSQLNAKRTRSKGLIEKLILQETFTREECDKMIQVLNSRVVDWSKESAKNHFQVGSPGKNYEVDDMYNKVAQEAKKWFKDKKAGSSSVTEFSPGTAKINSSGSGLGHVQSGEGSPVDVARSYMKERPRWASPTLNVDVETPLSLKLFKDGASYFVANDSFSSSKKRRSLASGSWNIREELQKVRAKATEDMLRTSAKKIDPLSFAPSSSREGRLGSGKLVFSAQRSSPEPVDVLTNAGAAGLEPTQDGMTKEALPSHIDGNITENNQDLEVFCANNKDTSVQNHDVENHTDPESTIHSNANGIPASQARVESGQNHDEQRPKDENHKAASDIEANSTNGNSENPGNAYHEVPIVTETESAQENDLGVQTEGMVKQQGKKSSRIRRKGCRGRGLSKG